MQQTENGRLYTDIVLEIFKLSGMLVSAGDELVAELGLTSARWKVLGAISISGEPLTVARIAHQMGQTRQGVQRIVDAMSKDGIVELIDNPYHKKAKLVKLTNKGEELYSKADDIQIEWSNALADGFHPKELEKVSDTLKSIYDGLKSS